MHPIAGDTQNMSVLETRTGQEFRFVLPGPTVDPTQSTSPARGPAANRRAGFATRPVDHRQGSLPPGMPHDFMRNWPTQPNSKEYLLRSTPGAALAAALEVGVAPVKQPARVARLAATAAEHRAGMR